MTGAKRRTLVIPRNQLRSIPSGQAREGAVEGRLVAVVLPQERRPSGASATQLLPKDRGESSTVEP